MSQPRTEDILNNLNQSLPFSDEAEMGVLSSILQFPDDRLPEAKNLIPVAAFYHKKNRTVFETLLEMLDRQEPIEIVSITHKLREKCLLEVVGGAVFMSELWTFTAIPSAWGYYLQILEDKHRLRSAIHESAVTILNSFQSGVSETPVGDLLDDAERRISSVRDLSHAGKIETTASQLARVSAKIQDRMDQAGSISLSADERIIIPGLHTGITALDDATNGLCEGHTWVISGGVGDGKTALASQILAFQAENTVPCCYYLTEDSGDDWWTRVIALESRVDLTRILRGELSDLEASAVAKATFSLQKRPIFLRHLPELSDRGLISDMRWMMRKHHIRVFAVDYVQNIELTRIDREREDESLVRLMKRVGALTATKKVTTICLSQLNDDGKLAGAKGIARVANVIFRMKVPPVSGSKENVHNPEAVVRDFTKRDLQFGKARMTGHRGKSLPLSFNGPTQRFS